MYTMCHLNPSLGVLRVQGLVTTVGVLVGPRPGKLVSVGPSVRFLPYATPEVGAALGEGRGTWMSPRPRLSGVWGVASTDLEDLARS